MCSDVHFLKSCAFSSQNLLGISEMLPEVRQNTPITTFLSQLLLVQMLSFQAGLEGGGWQNSPGERWWYKPAWTVAPTSHQAAASVAPFSEGYPDQPASRVCAACVQRRQLSRQGHACPGPGRGYWSNSSSSALLFTLSKEEVGAGTFSALSARWRGGGRSCWEAGGWAVGESVRSARRPQTSHAFLPEGEVGVQSFLSNVEHSTHRDKMEGAWPRCQFFSQLICKELPGFSETVKTS